MQILDLLRFWRDLLDIAVAAVLFWGILLWLRRTKALFAFLGLAILAAVYLLARQAQLNLTAWIFQGFSAVLLILIVVVFQDDLRRLLEQIGAWGAGRRQPPPTSGVASVLVRTLERLAHERAGALLVLPGREPVDRHLEGGLLLEGHLSEPLLLSLFDPHSPGHDGAAVVVGNRVVRFGCHLPLSTDHQQVGSRGTRHAAALGMAERTDALCIVVSEERGTVSVARDGVLRQLAEPRELGAILRAFTETALERRPKGGFRRFLAPAWPHGALALGLAVGLWFPLVPGSSMVEAVRGVPVVVQNLPVGYVLESVEPERVEVTLSGPRRAVYFAPPDQVQVRIDAFLAQLGRRTFQVTSDQVDHPPEIEVLGVSPGQIRISLRRPDDPKRSP